MLALIALSTKAAVHLGNYSVITSSLLLMPDGKKNPLHFLDDGCFPSLRFRNVDSWLVVYLVKKKRLGTFSEQEWPKYVTSNKHQVQIAHCPCSEGAGVVSFWRRQRDKLCMGAVRLLFPIKRKCSVGSPIPTACVAVTRT